MGRSYRDRPTGRPRHSQAETFRCGHCKRIVGPVIYGGSQRNHCPFCLWSRHVDDLPGDRASQCRALMEPIGLVEKSGKGWQVVHRCTACGHRQPNRLVRDGDAPDDLDLVLSLPWL